MNTTRIYYQWMRLEAMDQWWHWLLFVLALVSLLSYVVLWYRRDWQEIPRSLGWTLLILRLSAFAGILFFFFDLQKRTEQQITKPSKLAVLVDTSLSMSLPARMPGEPTSELDAVSDLANSTGKNGAISSSASPDQTRMDTVVDYFKSSSVLDQWRSKHDVTLYRFDSSQRPSVVAALTRPKTSSDQQDDKNAISDQSWKWIIAVAWIGMTLFAVGIMAASFAITMRVFGSRLEVWPYFALFGIVGVLCGLIIIATSSLRTADYPISSLLSFTKPRSLRIEPEANGIVIDDSVDKQKGNASATNTVIQSPSTADWATLLRATGVETRLGDAIESVVELQQSNPLSGIVIITDGQSNSGIDPISSVANATSSNIPIFAIGVGSPNDPVNVRVVDVEAPKRVFPDDRFRITALLQSSGLRGKPCLVQLRRQSAADKNGNLTIEEEQTVALEGDEQMQSVSFDVKPSQIGAWTYDVKIVPPTGDANAQDNASQTEVRVIEPKSTVLVIAGGPTREYQFVRNLLYRDKTVQSHVLLQTAGPGMSQEADQLLVDFPSTMAEMAKYDCVLAFDADWMKLSVPQIETLEKWVSQQAGGLVLIAGPVATPRWSGSSGNGDRRAELLRDMSPVVLNSRGTRLISMGRFESETIWPLRFSENARSADFLQLATENDESVEAWNQFTGIYSFFAAHEPKPGALPLVYFSDPATAVEGKLPVFLASQFYGAGRVVFQGSGEIWRLRQVRDDYFDSYYTKLVRWAGQGRLQRDSDRGLLLLDKQQALVGDQIAIRAILRDNQFQPLVVPSTPVTIVDPAGRSQTIDLKPIIDSNQAGAYVGSFLAKQTGSYEVRLNVGSLSDQQTLTQSISVRVPTREVQRPQRNDRLLTEMTQKSGGKYWPTLNASLQPSNIDGESSTEAAVAAAIVPREQVNFLPGAPDRLFQQRLMGNLMAFIGLALSLEWLIRRLSKLA